MHNLLFCSSKKSPIFLQRNLITGKTAQTSKLLIISEALISKAEAYVAAECAKLDPQPDPCTNPRHHTQEAQQKRDARFRKACAIDDEEKRERARKDFIGTDTFDSKGNIIFVDLTQAVD